MNHHKSIEWLNVLLMAEQTNVFDTEWFEIEWNEPIEIYLKDNFNVLLFE